MANATTYRRILAAISVDDESSPPSLVLEVPRHGPVVLTAETAHERVRALVLDKSIPHRKGDAHGSSPGDWFAELGRVISDLGTDEREAPPDPLPEQHRRIVVAFTVDGDALLVEAPQRAPIVLSPARTFDRLCVLARDPSIPTPRADAVFNPRTFFRGVARGLSQLGEKDEPAT